MYTNIIHICASLYMHIYMYTYTFFVLFGRVSKLKVAQCHDRIKLYKCIQHHHIYILRYAYAYINRVAVRSKPINRTIAVILFFGWVSKFDVSECNKNKESCLFTISVLSLASIHVYVYTHIYIHIYTYIIYRVGWSAPRLLRLGLETRRCPVPLNIKTYTVIIHNHYKDELLYMCSQTVHIQNGHEHTRTGN